jgi:hypothetical protein
MRRVFPDRRRQNKHSIGALEGGNDAAEHAMITRQERPGAQLQYNDRAEILDCIRLEQHVLVPSFVQPVDVEIRVEDDALAAARAALTLVRKTKMSGYRGADISRAA